MSHRFYPLSVVLLTALLLTTNAGALGGSAVAARVATPERGQEPKKPDPSIEPPLLITAGGVTQYNNFFAAGFAFARYRNTYGIDPESKLLNNLYWEAGAGVVTSIYTHQLVMHAEWSPLAIVKLRLSYAPGVVLGLPTGFGPGLPFDDERAPFGDDVLSARKGENVFAFTHQFGFRPTLQAKLWKIIMMNQLNLTAGYTYGDGGYLYDILTDSLVPRDKLNILVEEKLLVLGDLWSGPKVHKLYAGPVYQYNLAADAQLERHRLGGMVLYSPVHRWSSLFEPTAVVSVGVNLVDRNREGGLFALLMLRTGIEP